MGRLLIIDDDKTDRFLIKRALLKERASLELIELEQGLEAVQVIKETRPVATILDIRMPVIDGFEVLKMIRKDAELTDHLVFMVSGSEEPSDIDKAMKAGANGYLTKPGSVSEYGMLAKTIHERIFDAA